MHPAQESSAHSRSVVSRCSLSLILPVPSTRLAAFQESGTLQGRVKRQSSAGARRGCEGATGDTSPSGNMEQPSLIVFSRVQVGNIPPLVDGNRVERVKVKFRCGQSGEETAPCAPDIGGFATWKNPLSWTVRDVDQKVKAAILYEVLRGGRSTWSLVNGPAGSFEGPVARELSDVWQHAQQDQAGPSFHATLALHMENGVQGDTRVPPFAKQSLPGDVGPSSGSAAQSIARTGLPCPRASLREFPAAFVDAQEGGPPWDSQAGAHSFGEAIPVAAAVHAGASTFPARQVILSRTSSSSRSGRRFSGSGAGSLERTRSAGGAGSRMRRERSRGQSSGSWASSHSGSRSSREVPRPAPIGSLRSPVGTVPRSNLLDGTMPLQENSLGAPEPTDVAVAERNQANFEEEEVPDIRPAFLAQGKSYSSRHLSQAEQDDSFKSAIAGEWCQEEDFMEEFKSEEPRSSSHDQVPRPRHTRGASVLDTLSRIGALTRPRSGSRWGGIRRTRTGPTGELPSLTTMNDTGEREDGTGTGSASSAVVETGTRWSREAATPSQRMWGLGQDEPARSEARMRRVRSEPAATVATDRIFASLRTRMRQNAVVGMAPAVSTTVSPPGTSPRSSARRPVLPAATAPPDYPPPSYEEWEMSSSGQVEAPSPETVEAWAGVELTGRAPTEHPQPPETQRGRYRGTDTYVSPSSPGASRDALSRRRPEVSAASFSSSQDEEADDHFVDPYQLEHDERRRLGARPTGESFGQTAASPERWLEPRMMSQNRADDNRYNTFDADGASDVNNEHRPSFGEPTWARDERNYDTWQTPPLSSRADQSPRSLQAQDPFSHDKERGFFPQQLRRRRFGPPGDEDGLDFSCWAPPTVSGGRRFSLKITAGDRVFREDDVRKAASRGLAEAGTPTRMTVKDGKLVTVKLEMPEDKFKVLAPSGCATGLSLSVRDFVVSGRRGEVVFDVLCKSGAAPGSTACKAKIAEGTNVKFITFNVEVVRPGCEEKLINGDSLHKVHSELEGVQNGSAIIPYDELEEEGPIGKGHKAVTFKGRWRGPRGRDRAVAIKRLPHYQSGTGANDSDLGDLMHEATILALLGPFPHVVEFYGVSRMPTGEVLVVTKYEAGGSLDNVLGILSSSRESNTVQNGQRHGKWDEYNGSVRRTWLKQVAHGIKNAHEAGVLHNDVAARNVLLTGAGPKADALVCDFGCGKSFRLWEGVGRVEQKYLFDASKLLMRRQLPMEALDGACYLDEKTDAWMLGLTMFEVYNGSEPFPGVPDREVEALVREGRTLDAPEKLKDEGSSLVKLFESCVNPDRSVRPTVAEVVARWDQSDAASDASLFIV